MFKSKKATKTLCTVLAIAFTVSLALTGCGGNTGNKDSAQAGSTTADTGSNSDSSNAKKIKIMFDCPKVNDPVWLIAKEGFEAAAKEFGFEGVWTGADDHSVEKTVEAVENTVAQKPDGIVTCPFSPTAFTKTLEKAKENDIKVTVVAVDAEKEDLRAAFIGTDSVACGTKQIQAIIEKVGKDQELKLGVLMSNVDSANQVLQLKAAEAYMKSNNIKYQIFDKQADNADPVKSVDIVTSMLKAHPEINAILSTESGGTPGVGKALAELKLNDKVVAICMDDTKLNLDTISKGEIYGVMAQDFYKMGYLGGKYCFEAINGKSVPSKTDSGVVLVTKGNLTTYKDERK